MELRFGAARARNMLLLSVAAPTCSAPQGVSEPECPFPDDDYVPRTKTSEDLTENGAHH